jgi:hypothetical protein
LNYVSQNGNNTGYFGTPRVINNFDFVKDDIDYEGSIHFTPESTGLHNHSGQDFLHLSSVAVTDNPTGSPGSVTGNIIVSPTSTQNPIVEVPAS